jgi:hypothetical protein
MGSHYISFQDQRSVTSSFASRVGDPDECSSALGFITIGFSWLEDSLSENIGLLADLTEKTAPAITSELSFRVKVGVLSSLVRAQGDDKAWKVGSNDPHEVWNDIVRMLFECEGLRNRIVHSSWSLPGRTRITRTKTTAKPARGVQVASERLTSDYLLDVYDYILNVQWVLDEFFLLSQEKQAHCS